MSSVAQHSFGFSTVQHAGRAPVHTGQVGLAFPLCVHAWHNIGEPGLAETSHFSLLPYYSAAFSAAPGS